jgi:hypothetical protein
MRVIWLMPSSYRAGDSRARTARDAEKKLETRRLSGSGSGPAHQNLDANLQFGVGSANTIRPTSLTYPDGRVLTYGYGTADGNNAAASRVESLIDDDVGSTHLADYQYLGQRTFVEVDYTEPDIKNTLVGTAGGNDPDTGDIYRGLDRFGRIKDSYWYNYGTGTDVDRIKYGYDRNGNRLRRENTVAAALGKHFDELYGYDLVDRLKNMDRGDLSVLLTLIFADWNNRPKSRIICPDLPRSWFFSEPRFCRFISNPASSFS